LMPSFGIAGSLVLLLHSLLSVFIPLFRRNKPSFQVLFIKVILFLTISIPFVTLNYVKANYLNPLVNSIGHYDWLYINNDTHLRYELYGFMVSRSLILFVFIVLVFVVIQNYKKKKLLH